MSVVSKTVLKTYFESGDRPTQSNFEDLIDSLAAVSAVGIVSLTGEVIASGAGTGVVATIASALSGTKLAEGSIPVNRHASAAGQSFIANATTSAAIPTVVAITSSQLVGSPAAGGITGITLGAGLSLSGSTLNASTAQGAAGNGGFKTNYYYTGFPAYGYDAGTFSVAANRLYCRPFPVDASANFTRIGVEVTTLAAGNARLGLYNWVNGVPTTLVSDLGTVSTGTTGEKEVTISQALTPAVYGIAIVFDATPSVRINSSNAVSQYFGGDTYAHSTNYFEGVYVAHAFGALPASFGAPTYSVGGGGSFPGMWMRVV